MMDQFKQIKANALEALDKIHTAPELEHWRVAFLGRSSPLMQAFTSLGGVPKEERRQIGQFANEVKNALESAYDERSETLRQAALKRSIEEDRLDISLPGRPLAHGRMHIAAQTLRKVCAILTEMGFQIYRSRDVETDEYNFQLLNFPPNHPARDMQDTFYIKRTEILPGQEENPIVLRTHTSPGQIHSMREYAAMNPQNPPPIRIILPGMCYRYEQITHRSEIQFHQVEGLAVGESITMANLKGTLTDFARRMYGQNVRSRFRASYFPFTEPSAEMDIECFVCGGVGCPVCKYSGWLEILGCGMVHPIVLRNGGYDPERYTGFAFGMGTERQIMLRYQVDDIRYFWSNDLRFLEQF
jgi:phenylalanyl-tRNA synthetase alpha chain